MRSVIGAVVLMLGAATQSAAQSLHLPAGTNGIELSTGWSVGPSSNGIETFIGGSIGGKVDLGVQLSHYSATFDDDFESQWNDYAPLVRWFPVKETDGAPVSLSVSGQFFIDDYESDEDSGKFVQVGPTVYKAFTLKNGWAITPFGGFGFVAESYSFGGGPAENAQYLTRDLGLHFTSPVDKSWLVRFTLLDQSFRRETYRGARIAVIRKL